MNTIIVKKGAKIYKVDGRCWIDLEEDKKFIIIDSSSMDNSLMVSANPISLTSIGTVIKNEEYVICINDFVYHRNLMKFDIGEFVIHESLDIVGEVEGYNKDSMIIRNYIFDGSYNIGRMQVDPERFKIASPADLERYEEKKKNFKSLYFIKAGVKVNLKKRNETIILNKPTLASLGFKLRADSDTEFGVYTIAQGFFVCPGKLGLAAKFYDEISFENRGNEVIPVSMSDVDTYLDLTARHIEVLEYIRDGEIKSFYK